MLLDWKASFDLPLSTHTIDMGRKLAKSHPSHLPTDDLALRGNAYRCMLIAPIIRVTNLDPGSILRPKGESTMPDLEFRPIYKSPALCASRRPATASLI